MKPVYTWTNFRLGVVPEFVATDGKRYSDVVTTIQYIRTVEDTDTKLSSQRIGQVYLGLPTTSTFIPLANVTQNVVISFVESSVKMDTLDYLLKEELTVIVNNQNLSKVANNMVNNMIVSPAITVIRN